MAPLTTANIPPLAWGLGYMYGYLSLISARLQRDDDALNYLQLLLLWLERAPAWTVGFPEMTCLAAETLWRLERRDQVGVVEQAVREKVLKPDFRSTMVDGRLALARLCALSGRHDEAQRWFAEARLRPRRTGRPSAARHCRLDEALMFVRRREPGDLERARPLQDAARRQFETLSMTGWIRGAEERSNRPS